MSGIILRVALIESTRFTRVKEIINEFGQIKTKLSGYIPDCMKLLQNKMEFSSNLILQASNQTNNGLIDAVANNVDVTIADERIKKVTFSSSIFDIPYVLLSEKHPFIM
jgi:ABC-type amino acid transport substrate-binding protein